MLHDIRVVTLPVGELIEHDHLRIVLNNCSRQLLAYHRRAHGFPRAFRQGNTSYTLTSAVADWLQQRGIEVRYGR